MEQVLVLLLVVWILEVVKYIIIYVEVILCAPNEVLNKASNKIPNKELLITNFVKIILLYIYIYIMTCMHTQVIVNDHNGVFKEVRTYKGSIELGCLKTFKFVDTMGKIHNNNNDYKGLDYAENHDPSGTHMYTVTEWPLCPSKNAPFVNNNPDCTKITITNDDKCDNYYGIMQNPATEENETVVCNLLPPPLGTDPKSTTCSFTAGQRDPDGSNFHCTMFNTNTSYIANSEIGHKPEIGIKS